MRPADGYFAFVCKAGNQRWMAIKSAEGNGLEERCHSDYSTTTIGLHISLDLLISLA